jgi:hypothetical protein
MSKVYEKQIGGDHYQSMTIQPAIHYCQMAIDRDYS